MPKINDLELVETIDETCYVPGTKAGSTVRFRADSLGGATQEGVTVSPRFTQLDDTPTSYTGSGGKAVVVKSAEDGVEFSDVLPTDFLSLSDVPTSYSGSSGKVVAVNSSEDGLAFVMGGSTSSVIDLSSASEDYSLGIGETAKIVYSSTTSVPLHVATVEGEYEVIITGKSLAASPTNNNVYLSANNTTYSNAIKSQHTDIHSATITTNIETRSTFGLSYAGLIKTRHNITTNTLGKSVLTQGMFKYNSGEYQSHIVVEYWEDTTTIWYSLGTITFPYAQSGIVIIRRII